MQRLLEKDKQFCSQGDTSSKHTPKKIFQRAKGSFLYDEQNIKYLDMQMFNSAANFGYQNESYNNCLMNQLHTLPALAAEFMNESRILLSEKICNYMYSNYGLAGRVHFTVGGAQAVDDALKLAFNYTNNHGVICFEGAYHGRTMAASSISSSYRYTRQFGNVIDTYTIPFPCCSLCAYDKSSCVSNDLYCINRMARLFESEFLGVYDTNCNKSKYSTFIFEPVLGRGGYVFPKQDYYKQLFKLLRSHNIVTIADEVQMGFYRTGRLWSFEHYDICPDIIVFGKAISNGIWPLSGVWASDKIISPQIWQTGSTHCTFAGHPLGTVIGLETFNIIEKQEHLQKMQKSSQLFLKIIEKLKEQYSCIARAQILGHAAGIDICDPVTRKPAPELVHALTEKALNEPYTYRGEKSGLILTAGGFHNASIMLSPSVFISAEELNMFDELFHFYLSSTLMG
ncbi:MAG: aspartate aminotransferase family protein [Ruminococcus flavefaciens]|nr:aspartate aminotransferase family protein [Ruminococcus flavefaciens]